MKKILLTSLQGVILLCLCSMTGKDSISMELQKPSTIDSLGACQGAKFLDGDVYLYGDREVGVLRRYKLQHDSLVYTQQEYLFTENGKDVINHPTGIAYRKGMPTFIGNSVRLNKEGTAWKAIIYAINWDGFLKTKTLDGNLLNTIEDDACIQGCRPEYVPAGGKWYVATADYGNKQNEVRLYDAALLAKAKKTTEPGIVYKKFTCGPWVQNMVWLNDKKTLLLIQNRTEGKGWRFTYLDLEKSLNTGKEYILKSIDVDQRSDELEGFTFLQKATRGIAVTSSRKDNANFMNIQWN